MLFKKKATECGEREWAEPGTERAAGGIVSCAAWEGGELALSTSSLGIVGEGHPGTAPCPAEEGAGRGASVSAWENQEVTEHMDMTHLCCCGLVNKESLGLAF